MQRTKFKDFKQSENLIIENLTNMQRGSSQNFKQISRDKNMQRCEL